MPTDFEAEVQRIADSLEPGLRQTYLDAIAAARARFPVDLLVDSPTLLDAYQTLADFAVEQAFGSTAAFEAFLLQAVTPEPSQGIPASYATWTAEHAGRLITGLAEPSLNAVREVLTVATRQNQDPRRTALLLRDHLGVLPAHQEAAARYYSGLLDAGFPEARADELHALYTGRLRAWRADMVARTESMRAANMGQLMTWAEQAEQRLIDPDHAYAYWIVTKDDRLCPYCAPMDGQQVLLADLLQGIGYYGPPLAGTFGFRSSHKGFPDGQPRRGPRRTLAPDPWSLDRDRLGRFISKRASGASSLTPLPKVRYVLCPPLHPQCRCVLGLRFVR